MTSIFSLLLGVSVCLVSVYGHGYLLDPPARSSAWLVDPAFKQCCTYSNHMEMFCGGLQYQWNLHAGKCSICGEPYDRPNKLFEKGGSLYLGKIVKTYTQGQQVDVKVVLTANHKGYFEFRLCSLDSTPNSEATQECLDRRVLKLAGTDSTKYRDVNKYGSEPIIVRVQLPADVACRHCVFQWRYTTGNNWGTDPVTGQSGIGMGIENETFMGCADISIVANGQPVNTPPPAVVVSTNTPATTTRGSAPATTTGRPAPATTTGRPAPATTTGRPAPATTSSQPSGGATTWSSNGIKYKVGDIVFYNGVQYRCVFDHTSYPGAEPGIYTWAWWQRMN